METYLKNLETTELQKAKLVIGQFIASCSHSMRGPLKSIRGLVNLVQKNYSPEDATTFLELISCTANKMEHTLDELEHFLENSKRSVGFNLIDFHKLLNVVLDQYDEEINVKNIKIKVHIQQRVPFCSDVARLRIILENLLSNATQFQDVRKKKQTINVTVVVNDQTSIISVADNGIGISPENHLQIFQLFFRATERSSGTGVGLYVVKEAIEKMKGSICLYSALEKGATFRVILPNQKELKSI
jgi:signal transduction histidine kinase